MSEKIARLNRTNTTRDMYDLAWICSQGRLWSELGKDLIRRLAVPTPRPEMLSERVSAGFAFLAELDA